MAKMHKGELEIENGLGVPKKTNAQIAAQNQPEGYIAYNSDTEDLELRQSSAWKKIALAEDVQAGTDTKVDLTGDTMTGHLVMDFVNVQLNTDSAGDESRIRFTTDDFENGFIGEDAGGIHLKSTNRDLTLTSGTADLIVDASNVALTGSALTVNTTATFTGEVTVPTPVNAANPVTLDYFNNNTAFSTLTDTTVTSVSTGDAIFWNGTAWVNRVIEKADISDLAEGDYVAVTGDTMTGDLVLDAASIELRETGESGVTTLTKDGLAISGAGGNGVEIFDQAGLYLYGGNLADYSGRQLSLRNSAIQLYSENTAATTIDFYDAGSANTSEYPGITWNGQAQGSTFDGELAKIGMYNNDGPSVLRFEFGENKSNKLTMSEEKTVTSVALDSELSIDDIDGVGVGATGSSKTLVTRAWAESKISAAAGAIELDELIDVDVTTTAVATGQALFYNGTNWVNRLAVKSDISDFVETDYVAVTGDVMTGFLTLSAEPTADLHAATKKYVDDQLDTADELSELADVTITSAVTGDFLRYNGSVWADHVLVAADITDATTAFVQPSDSINILADVDTTTTSPATGDALAWDGTNFVPTTLDASNVDLSNYVTIDGVQTITGAKTFTNNAFKVSTTNSENAISVSNSITKIEQTGTATNYARVSVQNGRFNVSAASDASGLGTSIATYKLDANEISLSYNDPDYGTSQIILFEQEFTVKAGGVSLIDFKTIPIDPHMNFGAKATSPVTVDGDDDDVLTTKAWVMSKVTSAAGAINLDGLTDVTITTAADQHALMYDGSDWVNRALVKDDISDFDGSDYAASAHTHAKSDIVGFVETDYVHVTGNETIAGEKTFTGDVAISGDLTVTGTTTTVNSSELEISDSIIRLNKGETGAGATTPDHSGIEIERGSLVNTFLVWNELTDSFSIGAASATTAGATVDTGTLKAIATVDDIAATNGKVSFVSGGWTTASGTSTISFAPGVHGVTVDDSYHVTVYEGTEIVSIQTDVSAAGVVTLTTTGAPFAGRVRISL